MTILLSAWVLLAPSVPESLAFEIDGVERRADVYGPTVRTVHPPLVFGFHGHGGNSRNAARSFRIQDLWPEAVVVYMQGLPTPGGMTDPQGKLPGWQIAKGGQGDRDLKFFDAVYSRLTHRFDVEPDRVYAMGHSNGGRFTNLLMQQRGDLFAAFGPSGSPSMITGMPAKPVFHVAGEKDPLVKFEGQKRTLELLERRNGCSNDGKKLGAYATLYKGRDGNDVVAYFHPGGHEYPRWDVPPMLVRFFKGHPRHR